MHGLQALAPELRDRPNLPWCHPGTISMSARQNDDPVGGGAGMHLPRLELPRVLRPARRVGKDASAPAQLELERELTANTVYSFRACSTVPAKPVSPALAVDEVPHVTVIRPAKGEEPFLYECLASTFRQAYPKERLTVYFCVASTDDPAYPIIQRVLHDFPGHDGEVLVESSDPLLHGPHGSVDKLGPNPKIRNLSRAYRQAKGDIVWVVDCNVWVSRDTGGRMVDLLCGFLPGGQRGTQHKVAHQMPIVVDTEDSLHAHEEGRGTESIFSRYGGRLEELFMATTHAKFYAAINAVGVAPCLVGKSNMFRKSHLDMATDPARNPILPAMAHTLPRGIDYFSAFICEDHLIGDLLWRTRIPGFANHSLAWGDLVVQPMADMSVSAYVARRVRWLRVRKWTVLAATLVEPGVESLLCSAYLAFALTTLPWFHEQLGVGQTWRQMGIIWIATVAAWSVLDWLLFGRLHSGYSMQVDQDTPSFALGAKGGAESRGYGEWLLAWLGREALALPIWTWAVLLGNTVTWRGKKFRVGFDTLAKPVNDARHPKTS